MYVSYIIPRIVFKLEVQVLMKHHHISVHSLVLPLDL